MWEGTVVSIPVAREASAPMQSITEVRAFRGRGLEGDRYLAGTGFYSKKVSHGGREVSLIEFEAVEALFGGVLNAAGDRLGINRSIIIVDHEFRVDAMLMRGTRLCEPCKHLDDLTQRGVMSGLIQRGGLRAQILSEGVFRAS
jgi:hypothetical protein